MYLGHDDITIQTSVESLGVSFNTHLNRETNHMTHLNINLTNSLLVMSHFSYTTNTCMINRERLEACKHTRQCSFPWFSQWPVRPVRMIL